MNTTNESNEIVSLDGDYGYSHESILPEQAFSASYEISGQQHHVVIQWMGEGREVKRVIMYLKVSNITSSKSILRFTLNKCLL